MIQTQTLHDIAHYLNGRVAKVVINGTLNISQFSVKQVTDNVLVLNYYVSSGEVQTITLIELKDASGAMISSHAVNIPITADQLIIQSIEVKEAEA